MSIRSQTENTEYSSPPESSPENLASNFENIPACRLEDIDRALFDLFNEQLPLYYTHRNKMQKIPVVFATGERFALIARKKPLRDKSGALILPVISIMRTNVQMGNELGGSFAPDVPQIIKKQLSKEDTTYQRLINKQGFQNSDDLVSQSALIDISSETGSVPGRIATRRIGSGLTSERSNKGDILNEPLRNNIYEVYEIPPPVYITIDYDLTFWTQYMQEMNNLMSVIASECQFHAMPSFRIETKQGYKFVAYLDKTFSNQSNFEDFSEEERHIRSSMTVKVTGYILGSVYKASSTNLRKYVSAPQISFETIVSNDSPHTVSPVGVASSNPDKFIVDNLRAEDEPLPGQSIGTNQSVIEKDESAFIGGYSNAVNEKYVRIEEDPFVPGALEKRILVTKTKTVRSGETVYREVL